MEGMQFICRLGLANWVAGQQHTGIEACLVKLPRYLSKLSSQRSRRMLRCHENSTVHIQYQMTVIFFFHHSALL